MVLSRESSTAARATGVTFAPGGTPAGPEQTLWEGSPSIALVYGKILGIIFRAVILYGVWYVLMGYAIPAIQTSTPEVQTFIEKNGSTVNWAISGILIILFLPSVIALISAILALKNTHYKVTNQRILVETGVMSRSLEEIDMRSVDDIEFRQSFMERLFKIGAIGIVSTDKVAPKNHALWDS
jgi:membrane protein YdbS with pleckstrin-like domain